MDKTDAITLIDREIEQLLIKPLSASSVDLFFKLTTIRSNIKNVNLGHQNESQHSSSNQKYDRDINILFVDYIAARKSRDVDLMTETLSVLMDEIADLIVEIYNSAYCEAERIAITESIEKMKRH